MAVAIPARTSAPRGPAATIRPTRSSAVVAICSGSSELIMTASIERSGTKLVRLARTHGRAAIAPGGADIAHDGGDIIVGQDACKRWHAVGPRIALGARRIAAVQHHADRIDGGFHFDGL